MDKSFHSVRKQFVKSVLRESQVDKDPLLQLELWLTDAINSECPEPTAMVLSTAGIDLKPSSRVVLMKDLDVQGITFFTNYESRKGQQLRDNPHASLVFFWPRLERQVRIEGTVSKVTEEESDAYFASRPEASQISAIISPQSREIPSREWLEKRWQSAVGSKQSAVETHIYVSVGSRQLAAGSRPSNWGGYRLVPDYFEFWQGRAERLHDRLIYQPDESGWRIFRLAP
ncbi:MAG: pyridoxamine 5'-phosphate oxidase [Porphyromonadaceae bacterium]|nr:MAG: pyridoxamine 5'-phosphate oxidase [Porphyromonadaceae bacterium]